MPVVEQRRASGGQIGEIRGAKRLPVGVLAVREAREAQAAADAIKLRVELMRLFLIRIGINLISPLANLTKKRKFLLK